ncbi:MAG: hypothetical protein ACYSRP_06460 [Planctomycetota bacterium]|jgi:hypothetical protein
MNKHKISLSLLLLVLAIGVSSLAEAAEVWLKNNLKQDPTGDLVPVVIMYVDKVFVGREVLPGNTLVLSDLKPGSTDVTRFRISSGAFEYHVTCPDDSKVKETLNFTDIRGNTLPKGFSVKKTGSDWGDEPPIP